MKKNIVAGTVIVLSSLLLGAGMEDDIQVYINGFGIDCDVAPIIENDRTLVPIRAISEAVGFEVEWIAVEEQVRIKDGTNEICLDIDSNKYLFNNVEKELEVSAKIVNDRTMVPLSLIMDCFGYETFWNETERRVDVYMRYESDYVDDGFKTLVDLGIIDEADINKSENIPTTEALRVIAKTMDCDKETTRISSWYSNDELEPLDYLDDDIKRLALNLSSVMLTEDILTTDFEGDFTELEAVKYAVRMVNDTYSCVHISGEPIFEEKSEYYELAYIKGIIESLDASNADMPISRHDFYEIINKTIYVEYSSGGYGGVSTVRIIDRHERQPVATEEPKEKETIKLDITPVFSDDMSVSWGLPEEYSFLENEGYGTGVYGYNAEGNRVSGKHYSGIVKDIDIKEIIEGFSWDEQKNPQYFRITYDKYKENKEYYFDLYMPDIKVEYMDYTLTPGVYTKAKGQWPPKTISLSGGDTFKKDAYYILVSKQNKYRVEKYNTTSHWVFKVEEESDTFVNTRGGGIGGTIYTDEIRIREVRVEGDAESGFILYMTPDSDIFEVVDVE